MQIIAGYTLEAYMACLATDPLAYTSNLKDLVA